MSGVALGSQRRTKLTSAEAALLAGELTKPSWESRNEGIHERVSFEDSIWGFDLAGGSYYKTPLRVTAVKKDSRAEKAGIRPGDKLVRINDIDTSTLTIQEAHEIIIESGIHIRLAVSAPEDIEDSYFCYQDPIEIEKEKERQRKIDEENARRKRRMQCKINKDWSLQWPWVSKRRIIYKESNCFMVPSNYENRHRDKFPLEKQLGPKTADEVKLFSKNCETPTPTTENKEPIFENGNINNTNKSNLSAKTNEIHKELPEVTNDCDQDRTVRENINYKTDVTQNNTVVENDVNANVSADGAEIKDVSDLIEPMEIQEAVSDDEYVAEGENNETSEERISNEDLELEDWNPNEKKVLDDSSNSGDPVKETKTSEQEQDEVLDEISQDEEEYDENEESET